MSTKICFCEFLIMLLYIIAQKRFMASGERPRLVKVLAFDFDKTCTKGMILDIYRAREDYQNEVGLRKILDEEWQRLEKFYLAISAKVLGPILNDANAMSPQFDKAGLRHFLKEIQAIDTVAADELIKSCILRGITTAGIRDFAEKVELMPELLNVLKTLKVLNLTFHVVSLNFSKKLIQSALNQAGGNLPLDVHSNELEFKDGICTGNMDKKFLSAFDKEVLLVKIVQNADKDSGVSVYIGDSFTDLLALLEADIGLVIGDSKTLHNVCNKFGIHVVPLCYWNYARLSEKNAESRPVLFSVKSWVEIKNFVVSFNKQSPKDD